jgi:hypothetical protein
MLGLLTIIIIPNHLLIFRDGFHMFTPLTAKREQMKRQAENEQRQYEEHIERTRLHGIHEVHRLGMIDLF